jgi:hypothetical protein
MVRGWNQPVHRPLEGAASRSHASVIRYETRDSAVAGAADREPSPWESRGMLGGSGWSATHARGGAHFCSHPTQYVRDGCLDAHITLLHPYWSQGCHSAERSPELRSSSRQRSAMILGGGLPARTAVSPPPRRRPGIRGAAAGRAMRPPHPIPGQVASNTLQGTINAPAPKPLGGSEAAGCGRPRPAQPASGRDAHEPIDATPSARHGLPGHTPPPTRPRIPLPLLQPGTYSWSTFGKQDRARATCGSPGGGAARIAAICSGVAPGELYGTAGTHLWRSRPESGEGTLR